ncbi:MAG TPA: hypothetical protein VNT42_05195 [Sphingomonas sp.]|nr:hypothetical protein [Sphingomonas sp.]
MRARATAGGQYLNAQPSSQYYADTLAGKYLNGNPYLDAIVRQSDDAATRAVNQRFAAAGMGAGMSTPYADLLGRSIADSENRLRYGAYNDELNRMGAIGAQSDNVWSGERGRMDAANAQVAADHNANQHRALAAANSLGSQYASSGQLALGAQQAKDQAFNNDRSARLAAAQASDAQQSQQAAQVLQALGLTGELANAQYAGVAPALNLLSTASQIPYYGLSAYAGDLDALAGKYGTTTGTTTQSQNFGSVLGQLANTGLSSWASGGFKPIKL